MNLTKEVKDYTREELECIVETQKHVECVRGYIQLCVSELQMRQATHDASKFGPEELPSYADVTPKLKASAFGSDEYKGFLNQIRPAIDHHQKANRHHPEFFTEGVNGMNLIDILEMVCDWIAAAQRHEDVNYERSLMFCKERFGLSDQLVSIIRNTQNILVK